MDIPRHPVFVIASTLLFQITSSAPDAMLTIKVTADVGG